MKTVFATSCLTVLGGFFFFNLTFQLHLIPFNIFFIINILTVQSASSCAFHHSIKNGDCRITNYLVFQDLMMPVYNIAHQKVIAISACLSDQRTIISGYI